MGVLGWYVDIIQRPNGHFIVIGLVLRHDMIVHLTLRPLL